MSSHTLGLEESQVFVQPARVDLLSDMQAPLRGACQSWSVGFTLCSFCCLGMRGEHCKQPQSHVPRAALLILYIDTAQKSGYTPRVDASWVACQSPLQHH